MSEYFTGLKNSIDELFKSINALTESHSTLVKDVQELRENRGSNSTEIAECKLKIDFLENKLNYFEQQSKRKNLIVYNIQDDDIINNDLESSIENTFKKINLVIPKSSIDETFRLGSAKGKRPVIIKFNSSRWVKEAFSKLQDFRNLNLSISNDKTKKEREEYGILWDHKKTLKNIGVEVQIKRNKIVYNNKILSESDIASMINKNGANQSPTHTMDYTSSLLKRKIPTTPHSTKRLRGRPKKDSNHNNSTDCCLDDFFTKDDGTPRKSARLSQFSGPSPSQMRVVEKDPHFDDTHIT